MRVIVMFFVGRDTVRVMVRVSVVESVMGKEAVRNESVGSLVTDSELDQVRVREFSILVSELVLDMLLGPLSVAES